MLLAIILFPLLVGLISFKFTPRVMWVMPVILAFTGMLFAWESYLLYLQDAKEILFSMQWLQINDFVLSFDFKFDFTSMIIGGSVLLIAFLTFVYGHDFFSKNVERNVYPLLVLSVAMMLILVFSNNVVSMFFGWEGLSILGYFLISARQKKQESQFVALKTFLFNKIGDIFFLVALILLALNTETMNFDEMFNRLNMLDENVLRLVAIFLLMAIFIRSALLGFHVWFPETVIMYVPMNVIMLVTTISSGVYIAVKFFLLFEMLPDVLMFIVVLGALSAVYGAVLAIVQTNIKKILAYSTISFSGLMFVAVGMGYPMIALFLMMYHCLVKSLLFLSAGLVVTGLSTEHNINKMGGLYKVMPISYIFMLFGVVAINFMPIFVGYNIIQNILNYTIQSPILFVSMILFLFFTAGYSFRMLFKIFHGEFKESEIIIAHISEKKYFMIMALFGLLVSLFAFGYYGKEWFVFESIYNVYVIIGFFFTVIVGAFAAWFSGRTKKLQILKKIINDKRDFSELYHTLFVKPVLGISKFIFIKIEKKSIGVCEKIIIKSFSFLQNLCGMRFKNDIAHLLIIFVGIAGIVCWFFLVGKGR